MKALKIILIIILVLIVVVLVGGYLYIKNFDINRYKAQIKEKAMIAVARDVDFDQIDLDISMKEGLRFELSDLRMAEDPEFQLGDFFKVSKVFVGVDILTLAKKKEIVITSLEIMDPTVTIIRNKDGRINLESLGTKKDISPKENVPAQESQSSSRKSQNDLPPISINLLDIRNARLTFIDQTHTPALEFNLQQLDFTLRNFALNKPFELNLDAAVLSDQKNISLKAKAQLDASLQNAKILTSQFNVDLTAMNLGSLKNALSNTPGIIFPKELEGQFDVKTTNEFAIGMAGMSPITADISFKNGTVDIPNIIPDVSVRASHIDINISQFALHKPFQITAQAAYLHDQPNIFFESRAEFNLPSQQVHLKDTKIKTDISTLSLTKLRKQVDLLKDVPLPDKAGGRIELSVKDLKAGAKGLEEVLLDANLKDGMIDFKALAPGVDFASSKINLGIKDMSLGRPFSFDLDAAYLSEDANINIEGQASVDLDEQKVSVTQTKATLDLATLSFDQLKSSLTMLKDAPLPDRAEGRVDIKIKKLNVGNKGLESVLMDAELTGGMVDFKELAEGLALQLKLIDAEVSELSLKDPFTFSFKAAYLSDIPNLFSEGTVIVNPQDQNIKLNNTTFKTDLSNLSLDKLKASIAAMKEANLPEQIAGRLEGTVYNAELGAKGLEALSLEGEFKEGLIKLKELMVPIDQIQATFVATESKVDVKNLKLSLGEGTIDGKATLRDYLTTQKYNADININGIDLSKTVDQTDLPVKVQGMTNGRFILEGEGFDPKTMLDALTAEGNIEVMDGKLKDINILRIAVEKISIIPNLAEKLDESLSPEHKEKLKAKDTELKNVKLEAKINKGTVVIEPLNLDADDFILSGLGQAGFDKRVSFKGTFAMSNELSASMIDAVQELENLLNAENQIYMPVEVSGLAPNLKFRVDLKDVGKNAIKRKAESELFKVLDKVLDDTFEDSQPPADQKQLQPDPQAPTQQPAQQQEPSIEEQLIGDVLDAIFD